MPSESDGSQDAGPQDTGSQDADAKRADLYVVPVTDDIEPFLLRLALKATRQERQIHIRCTSSEAAASLDEKLWLMEPSSYLPHAMHGGAVDAPVTLGGPDAPPAHRDVLIDRTEAPPQWALEFDRVLAIVTVQAREKTQQRYVEAGYALNVHEIN